MGGRKKDSKVVPFQPDAAFYFERGVRYLNRHDRSKALTSFMRAVECEPGNAVNHCNLAGVYSELGNFEESNKILQKVISSIAPDMAECYFYMANNYANLGEYQLAEEHAVKYLEIEPLGEFAPDADEMLDVLIHEFGGGEILRERRKQLEEDGKDKDVARTLLEEGKFYEACHLLEEELTRNPDAHAVRNNLALARYYLGQIDEAIAQASRVLEKDPANIHALCNLGVFMRYHGKEHEDFKAVVTLLKKLTPLQFDQSYKLATTLGILGEHKAAHRLFMQLVSFGDRHDPELYFALAMSCAYMGKTKQAKQWLYEVEALDPESNIASHYLKELDKDHPMLMGYSYQEPYVFSRPAGFEHFFSGGYPKKGSWSDDPSVRSILYYGLQHGMQATKKVALYVFGALGDADSLRVIREFIKEPKQSEVLIWQGLFILQARQQLGDIVVAFGGAPQRVTLPSHDHRILSWNPFLEGVFRDVSDSLALHDPEMVDDAFAIWLRYALNAWVDLPRVLKRNVWSAALEYLTRRAVGRTEPQAVVAKRYGVSTSALSRAAHAITIML